MDGVMAAREPVMGGVSNPTTGVGSHPMVAGREEISAGMLVMAGSLALWPRFIEARFAGLLDLAQQLVAGPGAKGMGG